MVLGYKLEENAWKKISFAFYSKYGIKELWYCECFRIRRWLCGEAEWKCPAFARKESAGSLQRLWVLVGAILLSLGSHTSMNIDLIKIIIDRW